ncbi:hypothetical protein Btru_063913 [Bulinus truncatus]|nr:hypothetical protein Btru_063913 [Bulinus truncatus]
MICTVRLRCSLHVITFLCSVRVTQGTGTTLGTLFVVSNLKLMDQSTGSVEFILYTAWSGDVKVSVGVGDVHIQNVVITPFSSKHLNAMPTFFQNDTDLRYKPAYVFRGIKLFGLVVLIVDSNPVDSLETFLAIPVKGWGQKYFIVSLRSRISAQFVVGTKECRLKVYLRFDNESMTFTSNGSTYTHNSQMKIYLNSWQAFSLSNCELNTTSGSFTGTSVTGTSPFGVISGSCMVGTSHRSCSDSNERRDLGEESKVVEMLMPREQYGQEFIPIFLKERTTQGYHIAVAGEDDVTVTCFKKDEKREEYLLAFEGDYLNINPDGDLGMIKSNKGILVMYVMMSACFGEPSEVGDPSFCLLIPVELFYFSYIWSTPDSSLPLKIYHYVYIVVWEVSIPHLCLDGAPLVDDITWNHVSGGPTWRTGQTLVMPGSHWLLHEYTSRFGLYLLGMATSRSYMHPAGFITSPINVDCSKSNMKMTLDDLVDNDCDRRIDEEKNDGVDNDGDGAIDEDLRNMTDDVTVSSPVDEVDKENTGDVVDGQWGEWTKWHCHVCPDPRLFRARYCNNPEPSSGGRYCHGNRFEAKSGLCYFLAKCPESCPYQYWSVNCSKTCFNCLDDCRKYSGACDRCGDGYKEPNESCQTGWYTQSSPHQINVHLIFFLYVPGAKDETGKQYCCSAGLGLSYIY